MSSESLSVNVRISGEAIAPREILSQLLSAVARSLGTGFLGHIKGIARFSDGVLYASTVGLPPDVNFRSFGEEPGTLPAFEFELTCVAINLEASQLRAAVEEAIASLDEHYIIKGIFYDRAHQH